MTTDLAELLARPSYEVIPTQAVVSLVRDLPTPVTLTVACLASRGLDATIAVTERLAQQGHRVVPHLAARSVTSRQHLEQVATRLSQVHVDDVFVIGGDQTPPLGCYPDALSLLRDLQDIGHAFRGVGIAGYPDGHPLVGTETLMEALRSKQPYATYVVSQLCFDPAAVAAWLASIRRHGISLPVLVSVPGVVQARRLVHISLRIGVGQSVRYLRKNTGMIRLLLNRSRYRPEKLLRTIASELPDPPDGIAGLHICTFNQVSPTERWRQEILSKRPRGATDNLRPSFALAAHRR